jgi:hypothetical protein
LIKKGYPDIPKGEIYAVFEVEPDSAFGLLKWDGAKLWKEVQAFAKRRYPNRPTLHPRRFADPQVMGLSDVLRASV